MPPVTPRRILATLTLCRFRSDRPVCPAESSRRRSPASLAGSHQAHAQLESRRRGCQGGTTGFPPGCGPLRRWGLELLLAVGVLELALGDLLESHRQVVLRARLDERRRGVLEAHALTELVVVVVDLAGTLGGDDHERIARVDVLEQLIDAG